MVAFDFWDPTTTIFRAFRKANRDKVIVERSGSFENRWI